ncbi:unnamed protein product [Brassica oleracea]
MLSYLFFLEPRFRHASERFRTLSSPFPLRNHEPVQDKDGNIGINLSKDLMAIAGEALKANITTIGNNSTYHLLNLIP